MTYIYGKLCVLQAEHSSAFKQFHCCTTDPEPDICCVYADTGQADVLVSSRQQGTHSGKDVNVTGQALESPAVAGRAGTHAAAMGASGSQPSANGASMQNGAGPGSQETAALEPATQKALLPALLVMFKQHSVVNLADIRYVDNDGQAT